MPKPIIGLFIGDIHTGSDTGLGIQGYPTGSKDNRPYQLSANQHWLKEKYDDLVGFAELLTEEHDLFVGFGADLVDGVNHHGTSQTFGTYEDQIAMAADLLMPLKRLAKWSYGLLGTASHVGDMGDADRAVYTLMDVPYKAQWRLIVGDRLLYWQHHGIAVGGRQWTRKNSAGMIAEDVYLRSKVNGWRVPDAIVAHHRHKTFDPIRANNIEVGVVPCFQLSTYYGTRWLDEPDIGYMLWHVDINRLEVIRYDRPLEYDRLPRA